MKGKVVIKGNNSENVAKNLFLKEEKVVTLADALTDDSEIYISCIDLYRNITKNWSNYYDDNGESVLKYDINVKPILNKDEVALILTYTNRYWDEDEKKVVETPNEIVPFREIPQLFSPDKLSQAQKGSWFYAVGDMEFDSGATVPDDTNVNLILMDGCRLTLKKPLTVSQDINKKFATLKIYGQDLDSGKLSVQTNGAMAAIGADSAEYCRSAGNIEFNGGTIEAKAIFTNKAEYFGAAIGAANKGNYYNVVVNGGNVTASSNGLSAAIGSAIGGTMMGTITITGGDITAKSNECAAIGAGTEDSMFQGGECTGTINYTGGKLNLTTSNNAASIGHGTDGSKNGTLNLSPDIHVLGNGTAVAMGQRTAALQNANYTNVVAEPHSFGENNVCTVCGYERAVVLHTLTFDANDGSGTMPAVEVAENIEYTLPECGFTAPANKKFDGWKIGEDTELKQPGALITVAADTTVTAQWKNAYTISSSGIPNCTVTVNGDKTTALEGDTVEFSVVPGQGYTINSVSVMNGETPVYTTDNNNGTYTFTMPAGNVAITAETAQVVMGQALNLSGDIGVKLYLDSAVVGENCTVKLHKITNGGYTECAEYTLTESCRETVEVNGSNKSYYAVNCAVNAAEMTSEIVATVNSGARYAHTQRALRRMPIR